MNDQGFDPGNGQDRKQNNELCGGRGPGRDDNQGVAQCGGQGRGLGRNCRNGGAGMSSGGATGMSETAASDPAQEAPGQSRMPRGFGQGRRTGGGFGGRMKRRDGSCSAR